jgi:hypothetical protein
VQDNLAGNCKIKYEKMKERKTKKGRKKIEIQKKNVYCPEIEQSGIHFWLCYGLDDQGSRVRFPAGMGIFLFTTASRTALGPTQPPIRWVL